MTVFVVSVLEVYDYEPHNVSYKLFSDFDNANVFMSTLIDDFKRSIAREIDEWTYEQNDEGGFVHIFKTEDPRREYITLEISTQEVTTKNGK